MNSPASESRHSGPSGSIEPPAAADIAGIVALAIAEDLGGGDITAQLIAKDRDAVAKINAKEAAVLCGRPWAEQVLQQIDPRISIDWLVEEGAAMESGCTVAKLHGRARSLLTAERCVLNFLQTLSATATQTRQLSKLIAHTNCRLLDTRKTLPGLRRAQKYAVLVGGGRNHRMGLFDAFLIKENHIEACGGIAAAIAAAKASQARRPVEIEIRDLEQLEPAIAAGADTVMLDNFSQLAMREAVAINASRIKLEASGGVTETDLKAIAETGVDYISVGALTKNVRAIDLSMLLE